jgi:DNA-binding transcriptional MerR regulator
MQSKFKQVKNKEVVAKLTAQQVSELMAVSVRTIRLWTAQGLLPCYHLSERCKRYSMEDVVAFMEESKVA